MILSDQDLARVWPGSKPGPASIDLRIGHTLLRWPSYVRRDPRFDQARLWKNVTLGESEYGEPKQFWVLEPGQRYLATTRERIAIPDDLAGFISARSSWGRDGLAVICGPAGFLDPGYSGRPTLELSVVGSELVIWPGAVICQLVVHRLESPSRRPYSGRYQGDEMPVASRTHLVESLP
jgi:dCTP deaminase